MKRGGRLQEKECKVFDKLRNVKFQYKPKKCSFCSMYAFIFVNYGNVILCWRCAVRLALKDLGDWYEWKAD
ncbi:MAG: hypothetical protein QXL22_01140 [Candidatus Nezhaarchaeales archaeon]